MDACGHFELFSVDNKWRMLDGFQKVLMDSKSGENVGWIPVVLGLVNFSPWLGLPTKGGLFIDFMIIWNGIHFH